MGEHTSAPWRVSRNGLGRLGVIRWANNEAGINLPICVMESGEDDARLIAAAPRMKSALEQAVTSMLDSGYSVNSVAVRECQYALADARGESND